MNRQQRRALGKVNTEEIRMAEERLRLAHEKTLNDQRVETMMLLFALILHREFSFGQKRVYAALQAIDEEMSSWVNGDTDLEKLRTEVKDELGIEISF